LDRINKINMIEDLIFSGPLTEMVLLGNTAQRAHFGDTLFQGDITVASPEFYFPTS